MQHVFYTIYGYTYRAVLRERIGPVRLLEIPLCTPKYSLSEWDWSEYFLIVPANRYAIANKHADQDDRGNYYQRLIHYRHGGWTTSKRAAYSLLKETQRHPEHFWRSDGSTILKSATRHFASVA